ncbi:RidA family protein, partial [Streptomyces sp. NPDC001356]
MRAGPVRSDHRGVARRPLPFEEPLTVIRRVTAPALFPPPTYSHASVVEAGTKLAFLAGAVPLDERG